MISIIVPVYNVKEYLNDCVESIINQTYKDIEILLVDDGSTDSSGNICEELAQKDQRIRVFHQTNQGLSSARNLGIDNSKGDFLAFVDSDDSIHPQMIEILLGLINKYDAELSVCGFERVYENDSILYSEFKNIDSYCKTSRQVLSNLGEDVNPIVAWNKLYRRELFESLRYEVGRVHEDEIIIHRLIDRTKLIAFTDVKLYYYYCRATSITGSVLSEKRIMDFIYAGDERRKYLISREYKDETIFTIKLFVHYLFENYYELIQRPKTKKRREAIRYIKRIYREFAKSAYALGMSTKGHYIWDIMWSVSPKLTHIYTKIRQLV